MKITKNLPQFSSGRALFVSTGNRDGKIYLVFRGELELLTEIKVEPPKYSDKESFFAGSGRSKRGGTGSAAIAIKEDLNNKFLAQLKRELTAICKKMVVDSIYLFAPRYLLKTVVESLPKAIQQKIVSETAGNFVQEHPFVLLKKGS